jgi:hypothetical protein
MNAGPCIRDKRRHDGGPAMPLKLLLSIALAAAAPARAQGGCWWTSSIVTS